jgi:hypothetical protein
MGGNVAVTIRSNGVEWRMDRWTNPLPEVLHNPDFLNRTNGALQAYVQIWLDMGQDWAKHGPNGPFKHNMTEVYAPYPFGLKPSEYGAIVVDFDTGHILECQGYTAIGTRSWHAFEYGYDRVADVFGDDHEATVLAMEKAGRVRSFDAIVDASKKQVLEEVQAFPGATVVASQVAGSVHVSIPTPEGLDGLRAYGQTLRKRHTNSKHFPLRFVRLTLDMAPFTVESFEVSDVGFTAMLQRVQDLGFVLTDAEQAAWAERIAES